MPPTAHVCQDSHLSVYERTTAESDKRREFCGAIARDLQLTSNRVYLRMFSKTRALMPAFRIVFTVFKHGPCPTWLFHCGDNTCINKSLVCNDQVNCNYSLDEAICRPTTETSSSTSVPLSASVQTLAVAMVTGAIVTIVFIACLVACRQRHRERRLRRHALKQEARNAEGADLLGLGAFDWPPTHVKACSTDAAATVASMDSDYHNPLSQPNDSEFHGGPLAAIKASRAVASNFETSGTAFQGPISEQRGPELFQKLPNDSRSSNHQGIKLESNIYEKAPQRPWKKVPYEGSIKCWSPSSDGYPRFPSEFPLVVPGDDMGCPLPHRSPCTPTVPSSINEDTDGVEIRWGGTGSRTLPPSRYYDGLQDCIALPRTASGPDVIVGGGNRSRGARRRSQTGKDGDAILEPITVAGETTFPVHPEATSAARLSALPPTGTHVRLSTEPAGVDCDLGVVRPSAFLSDASGVSVARVGRVVSKRYHSDAVEASGAGIKVTYDDRRPNETERRERVPCSKDDGKRESGRYGGQMPSYS